MSEEIEVWRRPKGKGMFSYSQSVGPLKALYTSPTGRPVHSDSNSNSLGIRGRPWLHNRQDRATGCRLDLGQDPLGKSGG